MKLENIPDYIQDYARKNHLGAFLIEFLNSDNYSEGIADWSKKLLELLDTNPAKGKIIFASDSGAIGVNLGLNKTGEVTYNRAQIRRNIAENIRSYPEVVDALLPYPTLHKWLYVPVNRDFGNGIFPAQQFYKAFSDHPDAFKEAYKNNTLGQVLSENGNALVYNQIYNPSNPAFLKLVVEHEEKAEKAEREQKNVVTDAYENLFGNPKYAVKPTKPVSR